MADSMEKVAIIGAGLIGASWAALFLASGRRVSVYDPASGAEQAVRDFIEGAQPDLKRLGFDGRGCLEEPDFSKSAAEAVEGAEFVQESVPENLEAKIEVYREIEPFLEQNSVVATSASGITLSELQGGWKDPSRLVLGHPFNPPHLIPLVEVMENERTGSGIAEKAASIYESMGKVTIRLRKEVPGHVANRLQAAIWREAIHLAREGVASVEDIDKAVAFGPGIRWAAMGPTQLFHLAAGSGGIDEFCKRYSPSFHRWWDDLGNARLDAETREILSKGIAAAEGGGRIEILAEQRNSRILAILEAVAKSNS